MAVGLFGSFSGKSRLRRTSENRASFSMCDEKMCVLLTARFVSIRSWFAAKRSPKPQLPSASVVERDRSASSAP